jgi:thiosulfate reductase cytochrome b subunit
MLYVHVIKLIRNVGFICVHILNDLLSL